MLYRENVRIKRINQITQNGIKTQFFGSKKLIADSLIYLVFINSSISSASTGTFAIKS